MQFVERPVSRVLRMNIQNIKVAGVSMHGANAVEKYKWQTWREHGADTGEPVENSRERLDIYPHQRLEESEQRSIFGPLMLICDSVDVAALTRVRLVQLRSKVRERTRRDTESVRELERQK